MNIENKITILQKLLKSNTQEKKEEKQMENKAENKDDKKRASKVAYVYGQIYRGYLESGGNTTFTIQNIHVREWKSILFWLKKKQYIVDFELGNTIDTACELAIEGFDNENLIYEKYIEGVRRNIINETRIAA